MKPLLLDIPSEFSSERLQLRSYRPVDAEMFYQMLRKNSEHLYEFMPHELMDAKSVEEIEVVIRKHLDEWNQRNLFRFGAWEKATGAFVGEAYLANPDWDVPRIEVGYFLVKEQTGKGFATEAARATIQFAFQHMKVLRVELQCKADNEASQRVAERCGFKFEGRFRQWQRKKSGSLVDVLWYGLLRSEQQD